MAEAAPMSARVQHLIIDGYNVIFQAQPYAALARDGEWDRAREALISDVASFVKPAFRVTVVFDGTHNPSPGRDPVELLGVTVLFSPYGQTADAVIERLVKDARGAGQICELVSSDQTLQWVSLGKGVVRRSAAEFVESLHFGYSEWERERDAPPVRTTLSERVSAEAAGLLRRIRDGESSGGDNSSAG
jgi:predicted RNA-binding protein with PIN domain